MRPATEAELNERLRGDGRSEWRGAPPSSPLLLALVFVFDLALLVVPTWWLATRPIRGDPHIEAAIGPWMPFLYVLVWTFALAMTTAHVVSIAPRLRGVTVRVDVEPSALATRLAFVWAPMLAIGFGLLIPEAVAARLAVTTALSVGTGSALLLVGGEVVSARWPEASKLSAPGGGGAASAERTRRARRRGLA